MVNIFYSIFFVIVNFTIYSFINKTNFAFGLKIISVIGITLIGLTHFFDLNGFMDAEAFFFILVFSIGPIIFWVMSGVLEYKIVPFLRASNYSQDYIDRYTSVFSFVQRKLVFFLILIFQILLIYDPSLRLPY